MIESKSVKALKKQLAAAIAMVCVAAVALGSSTYAWFVSNNSVKATTSTISAQSNAAFMYIRDENEQSKDLTFDTSSINSTALYPAHWVTVAENSAESGNYKGKDAGKFYTAYGTTANDGTMTANTLKIVEASTESTTKGSPADAVTAQYAVKNTFYVGSKGTTLSNLVVAGASFTDGDGTTSTSDNTDLDNALRILVTCGDNWVLCDKDGVIEDSEGRTKAASSADLGKFGTGVTVTHDADTLVTMYVYYDGNDAQIYSNNLPNLETSSSRITVTFTADPQNS